MATHHLLDMPEAMAASAVEAALVVEAVLRQEAQVAPGEWDASMWSLIKLGGTTLVLAVSAFAATDSVTIFESDSLARTNLPVTFGRPFVRGEIAGGSCPQPVIGGTPVSSGNWQFDLKNSWPDGSVKFGVVSFIVPALSAGGSQAVTFQSGTCNNTEFLTQTQMVNFNSGSWGAALSVTADSEIVTSDAATMLAYTNPGSDSFGDCQNDYWLQGPVVTAVIVQDCTSTTHWDFGWLWNGSTMADNSGSPYSGNCSSTALCAASLHPWYVLYFYPLNNAVRADYVLENTWVDRGQDQLVNVAYLTGPSSSRATVLNYAGTPRKLTDVTLASSSDAITSASANFQSSDVGSSFSSPFGDTTICSVQSATAATLCAPSAASGTNQTVYLNDWLFGQMYRKTFWTGTGNPGDYLIDHNWPYIVSTQTIVPYDTTKSASPDSDVLYSSINGCGLTNGTDYTCFSQQVLTNVGFTQTWNDMGERGGHGGLDEQYTQADNDPTPMSRQNLLYLTNMSGCGTANGECSKAWFMLTGTTGARDTSIHASITGGAGIWNNTGNSHYHMRESRTTAGHFFCPNLAAGTYANTAVGTGNNVLISSTTCGTSGDTAFGRVISRYYDATIYGYAGPVGRPAGSSYSTGYWNTQTIRWLEFSYAAYLITGDYYYGLESQMNGAYAAASLNAGNADYTSNGFFAFANPEGAILRQEAGITDAIEKAYEVSPDGTLEQEYFDSILASNAEIVEGVMAITGTGLTPTSPNTTCSGFSKTASNRWDWGRCTVASFCGSGELQTSTCTPVAQALHMPVAGQSILILQPNVDAQLFVAGYAVAGTTTTLIDWSALSNTPAVGGTLYFSGATGPWTAINGLQTVVATGTTSTNCNTASCKTITISANTSSAPQPLSGSIVGSWGSFGQISGITSAASAVVTTTTTPASYPMQLYGCADQSPGTNWSTLNTIFTPATPKTSNSLTLPANTSTYPSFSQNGCFYSELGLRQDQFTGGLQGWMEDLWGIITNESIGFGLGYFTTIASEASKRLIEKIEDPNYNPWLISVNIQPVKGLAGGNNIVSGVWNNNAYFSTWASMLAAYTPETQADSSFWPGVSYDAGSSPCTDHAYALVARALAAYGTGVTDVNSDGTFLGVNAWNWANSNVPYFNNSPPNGDANCGTADNQIKFAFAPLPSPSTGGSFFSGTLTGNTVIQ